MFKHVLFNSDFFMQYFSLEVFIIVDYKKYTVVHLIPGGGWRSFLCVSSEFVR